jgi:hypothetical protein
VAWSRSSSGAELRSLNQDVFVALLVVILRDELGGICTVTAVPVAMSCTEPSAALYVGVMSSCDPFTQFSEGRSGLSSTVKEMVS